MTAHTSQTKSHSLPSTSALYTLALTACMTLACGGIESAKSENKILGGSRVPIGEWRSTVALTHNSGGVFCSGIAFNRNLVITAAHCVKGRKASDFKVYAGSGSFMNDEVGKSAVSIVEAHPRYRDFDNDIAYILLKTPLDYKAASSYVPFLKDSLEIKEASKIGSKVQLVGFGTRDSELLGEKWEVESKVVARAPGVTFNKESEIALGGLGNDSCSGDSGGPAYVRLKNGQWRVLGITSRGLGCGNGGIYTFLPAHLCWIEEASYVSMKLPEGFCS